MCIWAGEHYEAAFLDLSIASGRQASQLLSDICSGTIRTGKSVRFTEYGGFRDSRFLIAHKDT